MKLKKIEIGGFGKLINRSFEFCPGLNLIYGFNESGKSTLQRSILAALFGFFDDGPITSIKKSVLASYEPWSPKTPFGLKLLFVLDNGSQYRVDRTFAPKAETTLYDLKTQKNLNSNFQMSSQGRLFFAEKLLGMPREVFENTCMVRQAELAALEKSASAISDSLLRLSASGSQESTTSQSLEFLETAYKEQIGTQRSRNKPLPEAQRRLEGLQNSRKLLLSEYQALSNSILELAQVVEHFDSLNKDRDKAEYLHLSAQFKKIQQQSSNLEQADSEVARCQKDLAHYQVWSSFPNDSQSKIQRLMVQHEKSCSETQYSKSIVEGTNHRLVDLQNQIESLLHSLNSKRVVSDLGEIQNLSANGLNDTVKTWMNDEFANLTYELKIHQQDFESRANKFAGLIQIGRENLSKDRQELVNLEHELAVAEKSKKQVIETANQSGFPPDEWETILSSAETLVKKWNEWSDFPIHQRDELLQLSAQYTPLHQTLSEVSEKISTSENDLFQLKGKIQELEQQITRFENVRNIPHNQKFQIQEIEIQLKTAKQNVNDSLQQFNEIDKEYRIEQQIFDVEGERLINLNQLGIVGLTTFQQKWLNTKHQFLDAKSRLIQSKDTRDQVDVPIVDSNQLKILETKFNQDIQSEPKPRKGFWALILKIWNFVRSIFTPKQKGLSRQAENKALTNLQIQSKSTDIDHLNEEITNKENELIQVENELRNLLGDLVPEFISEDFFTSLILRMQNHQQASLYIEQRKSKWNTIANQLEQNKHNEEIIKRRLENELTRYGFEVSVIENSLESFYKACEQKEELITLEDNLERLQTQAIILEKQFEQFQTQKKSLANIEIDIINLLAKANIIAKSDSLPEFIHQFELGEEKYHQWEKARLHQEEIQKSISDFANRLTKTQSLVTENQKKLNDFRQLLVNKYIGLLPLDFTNQHLNQLDSELQIQIDAKSHLDRLQGQFERLTLQSETIRSNIANWVEREESKKNIENEILQTISAAGIQIDQLSLTEALKSYEEALDGYKNWQKAQQLLNAATQAQQAVRMSLPEINNEISHLETKIVKMTKQHPEWENLPVTNKAEDYEQNIKKLDDQILQERDNLTRLQNFVNQSSKNLRSLAELEEELALANSDVTQLMDFGHILEIAINELTIATSDFQKIFAPRLEQIVDNGLIQITNGRYQQVKIDPNSLNVSVFSPERKENVQTEQLSTGTRDLIYLLLRIGIAQLMSKSGEKLPLLLDDPLVEFDNLRQQSSLEFIQKLAGQTQILLFTKDQSILNWFKNVVEIENHTRIIELT